MYLVFIIVACLGVIAFCIGYNAGYSQAVNLRHIVMQRQGEFYIRLIQAEADNGYLWWVKYRKTGRNTYELTDDGNSMLQFYAPLSKHDSVLKHRENCHIKIMSEAEYNREYHTRTLWVMPLR